MISSSDRIIGRTVFITGEFEFKKLEKALSFLDKSFERKLLVDIGANIGTICIPAIKRNFFEYAIAFEPEPSNYSLLSSNISINGLSHKITPHNIALGDKKGQELDFEVSETNHGNHRIRLSSDSGLNDQAQRKMIRVKSEPLDMVLNNIGSNKTLIWMDTQGFEGYVLRGAERTLRLRPPLVIEFWPYGMNRCGSYQLLKQVICQAGYKVFYDLKDNTPPTEVSEKAFDMLVARIGDYELDAGRPRNFTDLLIT